MGGRLPGGWGAGRETPTLLGSRPPLVPEGEDHPPAMPSAGRGPSVLLLPGASVLGHCLIPKQAKGDVGTKGACGLLSGGEALQGRQVRWSMLWWRPLTTEVQDLDPKWKASNCTPPTGHNTVGSSGGPGSANFIPFKVALSSMYSPAYSLVPVR